MMRKHVKTGAKAKPQWYKMLALGGKEPAVGKGDDAKEEEEAKEAEDDEEDEEGEEEEDADEADEDAEEKDVKQADAAVAAVPAVAAVAHQQHWYGYDRLHRKAWRQLKTEKFKETTEQFTYDEDAELTSLVKATWADGSSWPVAGLTVEEYKGVVADAEGKVRHLPAAKKKWQW